MKILFLSHTDSNLFRFRLPVMIALQKQGHHIIALTPKGKDFDQFAKFGIQAIEYHILRSSLNPFSALKSLLQITRILRDVQPDIVHTFMLKPNIYGAFAAKLAGIPYVINSLTGLGSFYIEQNHKTKILRFLIESLSYLAFKISHKVLFQNRDDLELFVQKGLLEKNKAVLIRGSGIDTHLFSPLTIEEATQIKQDFLAHYPAVPAHCLFILMVARAITHKGVKEYYQAAQILKKQHPNYLFLYVGGIDSGNLSPVAKDFLESSKDVLYLGERNDIRELIGICDVFVLPSYREGIPRTLLEAGSMAKPIVTTNAVGCKEVVEDEKNGFLVPIQDAQALAKSIEDLCENPRLREEFGKASRQKVCAEFSVESIVREYLELYTEVLKTPQRKTFYKTFLKPILDFSLSLCLLIILSPILLVVALLIYLKMGSPVFFTQQRPGKNGKIFTIYKFRTMDNQCDKNGTLLPDNQRLKGFGKMIRKSSLDELPQLFNVLKGEMSFIGPRPLLVEYLPLYSKEQARRHEVKPGITGWAQVNGRNAISWEEKFKLDIWYVDHISFWLDCKILARTFYKVIQRKDISSSTSATMEKFQGNKREKLES